MVESPEPLTTADLAGLRAHPLFREVVRGHVAENRAHYAGLPVIERWMMSDLGRTALSGASVALAGASRLTLAQLVASTVRTGASSRGRARLYLDRAIANGLVLCDGPLTPDAPLRLSDRFVRVASQVLDPGIPAVARLAPEAGIASAILDDIGFRSRMAVWLGLLVDTRPDMFPAAGSPIHLFQGRDGGSRMLEDLILRQPLDGERLLGDCAVSGLDLARTSFCSRRHVARLFADGEALGLMRHARGRLTISQALSDDVELYYARLYAIVRTATLAVMPA
jgi:hypothetical protein